MEAHSQPGVGTVSSGSRNTSRGTMRRSLNPVLRFSFSSVIPAICENSAAERVVGIAMCGMAGSRKSSDNSLTMILAESIGLPPPMLIRLSALASLTAVAARVIPLIGACCLISEKTPANFLPDACSTFAIRSVLVAILCPVSRKGLSESILSNSFPSLLIDPDPKYTRSMGT